MKSSPFLLFLALIASTAPAEQTHRTTAAKPAQPTPNLPYTEDLVIQYAKSIDVHTLDPSLPSQHLEDWLTSGPPHIDHLVWIVADTCDLKPDDEKVDYPLCAKVKLVRGSQAGEFLIEIGTSAKGISGTPHTEGVGVFETEETLLHTGATDRLSGLPALLGEPAVGPQVDKLYEEIAKNHPLGLPKGADKAAIWPALSGRLRSKLTIAEACEQDMLRQHPSVRNSTKPSWMKTSLFSEEVTGGSLDDASSVSKEQQSDGSYLIKVQLGYRLYGSVSVRLRATGDVRDVTIRVVPEDGKYLVDDVRLFDGHPTDGSSHLLSESFMGCNGPHWVGLSPATK